MKINKIECPSCGFSFNLDKMDENNVCECPACKSSLHIDDEKGAPSVVNININNYGTSPYIAPTNTKSNKAGIIGGLFVFLTFMAFYVFLTINNGNSNIDLEEEFYSPRTQPESGAVIEFSETLFDKDLANISAEEYEKIAYLHIERDLPNTDEWMNADQYPWRFDYAFSVDDKGNPIDKKTVMVSSKKEVEQRDAQVFTNLIRLEFGEYGTFNWDKESYDEMYFKNLKSLKFYKSGDFFSSITNAFDDPSKIESLSLATLDINMESEIDISTFSGLKELSLDYVDEYDNVDLLADLNNLESLKIGISNNKSNELEFLSSLNKLKSLEIDMNSDSSLSSDAIFYGLPNIEKLSFHDMKDIKNINFIKNMPKLNSLQIDNCPIIDLEPLRDNINLTELSLKGYSTDKISDLSPIASLTNLKKLTILNVDVDENTLPNLSNLSMLSDVSIYSKYLNSINGMSQIEHLTLEGSYYSNINTMASLSGLKTLILDLASEDAEGIQAISELPNLEEVTVYLNSGNDWYIDPLFASKTVKSLKIINIDTLRETVRADLNAINDNNVITKLEMNKIYLEDVNNPIDDSMLGAYADTFLSHFKAVEELSIQENEVKSLEFVKNMPNLRILDISDNYVTDVSPLLSCKKLEVLKCKSNSISNLNVLPETVKIIKE